MPNFITMLITPLEAGYLYISEGRLYQCRSLFPFQIPEQELFSFNRDSKLVRKILLWKLSNRVLIGDDDYFVKHLVPLLKRNNITIDASGRSNNTTIKMESGIPVTYNYYFSEGNINSWLNLCRSVELFKMGLEFLKNRKFRSADTIIKKYNNLKDYNVIRKVDTRKNLEKPILTIVIVAYNTRTDLIECLKSMQNQTSNDFEIIIVDNGGNESIKAEIESYNVLHILCPINFILSEGRNIGVYFARGDYIAFLDDDALARNDYVESIIEAFKDSTIVGFRGRVLQKANQKECYTSSASHYDLGDNPFPHRCNAEGASAFRRKHYIDAGGMNPLLFGEEGTELSARLTRKHGLKSVVYWPKTVIFHNYADTECNNSSKHLRHQLMADFVRRRRPYTRLYLKKLMIFNYINGLLKKR